MNTGLLASFTTPNSQFKNEFAVFITGVASGVTGIGIGTQLFTITAKTIIGVGVMLSLAAFIAWMLLYTVENKT